MSKIFKALMRTQADIIDLALSGGMEPARAFAGSEKVRVMPPGPALAEGYGKGMHEQPGEDQPPPAGGGADPGATEPRRVCPIRLSTVCPLISATAAHSYAAEQYRIIRTKALQTLGKSFRLVVTSPATGDGKTLTAINLAVAMGLKGEESTLLLDADLRRAAIHSVLQVPMAPGLAEVLEGTARLEDAIIGAQNLPGLFVLPAGKPGGNPTELLASSRWRSVSDALGRRFARVVVDSPPVDIVADYDLIGSVCDGVVLVIRPDHTDRNLAMAAIEKTRPKLTGVVMNAVPEWFLSGRKRSRYSYTYRRDAGRERQGKDGKPE